MVAEAVENQLSTSHKKHVLIVDDDLELAGILRQLLEDFHYDVRTASNGALALREMLYQDVDAVICDLKMPELDGDLLYGTIERSKPHLCSRFIFLTGAAEDPRYHTFLCQVKSPVLRKPVQSAELLEELRRLLAAPGWA